MRLLKGRSGGIISVCGAVLIWGSTFVVSKVALTQIPPVTLAGARFVIATLVLLSLEAVIVRGRRTRSLPWGRLAAMGVTGVTLYFSLQNLGLTMTTASEASLVSASIPVITAVLGWVCLGERLGWSQMAGIGLATCGLAILILAGGGGENKGMRIAGDALLLGAAVSWVVYTLLGRRLGQQWSPLTVTAWSTGIGTCLLVPLVAWELSREGTGAGRLLAQVDAAGWLAVLFLGVVGSGMSFLLWNHALLHLHSAEAANFTNGVPVVGVIMGLLFLGESLRAVQVAGGIMVVAGVWLSTVAGRRGVREDNRTEF